MTIGIAGPMALKMINMDWQGHKIPEGYNFPMISIIINELISKGYNVVAYTMSGDVESPQVFKGKNITICVGRRTDQPGRKFFLEERKDLVSLMKENPADIINAQWSYEYALAALDSGIPTVVTLRDHATTILLYFKDMFRLVRSLINYKVLKKADYFISNSEYLKKLLSYKNQAKTRVISNFYSPFLEGYYLEKKPESKTIVTVANGFDKRKNIENGLQGFQLFRKRFPEYQYKLIGVNMESNGPAADYARKNGLEENVVFLGYKPFDAVIDEISKADILLHPSREESFGNTILEALVVGTNVVGGLKSGNVPYLLDHGNTGVLCDINLPDSIASAMEKIVSTPEFKDHLRKSGREFASSNYSKEKVIAKLIDTYEEIVSLTRKDKVGAN